MEYAIDPLLNTINDPSQYLMVIASCYHDGQLAKDGDPIRSQTVEDALCAIGQMMASLGSTDHRLTPLGHVEYHLAQ